MTRGSFFFPGVSGRSSGGRFRFRVSFWVESLLSVKKSLCF